MTSRIEDLTQMRKGILEYCVLARLRRAPAYGLELASTVGADRHLFGSEGTIYPLLSRLRKQGYVTTTWHESDNGPRRRYYELTPAGTEALDAFTATWADFRAAVDAVLEEAS